MIIARKSLLLAASALSISFAAPAFAQDAQEQADEAGSGNDIIVTAQRTEQRLQDVPISITVFDQEKLADRNILSAKDIATFTPGVYAQTRFGNDTTTYTIRGFAQEQRTTATVGTYFAEVVAPRGNGNSQGGDGASPGALFDLNNVQVLKGPQGTLFGRNTTGGAVLLVPVKPKDRFEGYVEATIGDLNRTRFQGVINLPLGDTLRVRLGIDRHQRDGYIQNIGITPKHDQDMGSIDVLALRGSVVWDVTPDIENYLIVSHSKSKSSGAIPLVKQTFTNPPPAGSPPGTPRVNRNFTGLANAQMAREAATGNFWTGTNANPLGEAYNEELRIINRTEFKLNDTLTLTNLFGYSEFKGNNAVDAFGLNSPTTANPTLPTNYFSFVPINAHPDFGLTANQKSIVEELRLTGETGALNWQAGLYYEKSSPKDFTGTISVTAGNCLDVATFRCTNGTGATTGPTKMWNETYAAYAQATYKLSEQLAITAGLRYTEDKTRSVFSNGRVRFTPADNWVSNTYECGFPGHPDGGPDPLRVTLRYPNTRANRNTLCFNDRSKKTSAPTWTLNLEYKPNSDILAYAKWSRGYRQGGIVPATGLPQFVAYDAEKVDAFELGAKTSWGGAVRGMFNLAAFYNKFGAQQIQAGINNLDLSIQTTTIVLGQSELYGLEADVMIEPADWFKLEAAYSYNHTRLQKITYPDLSAFGLIVRQLPVGGPLPLAVPHAFNATATLSLPVPESIGKISLSGTIVHLSRFRAVADAPDVEFPAAQFPQGTGRGILPKRTFGNINLNWKEVGGLPMDLAFYITNVTNEKMFTHINDQSNNGFIAYSVDEPRQWGVRLKWRFGD